MRPATGPKLTDDTWRPWFEREFARHASLVRAVIWNRLGRTRDAHQVEELAGETWARAVRASLQRDFDRSRDFATWVCTIAVNVWRESVRAQARTATILQADDWIADPREHVHARDTLELHAALAECIGQLCEEDRAVYDLRFERGMSGRLAAAELGAPEATFREKLLPRLLRRLALCLSRKGFEVPTADADRKASKGKLNGVSLP